MGRRILVASRCFLFQLFGDGEKHYRIKADAIPEDAEIIRVQMDLEKDDVRFLLQSSEWPDVRVGGLLPEIRPLIETFVKDASEPPVRFREFT